MASKSGAVWAIDIGNNCLKALRLSIAGGDAEVIGFDNIQHNKIVTGDGVTTAERDELIALSLRKFVNQNDLSKDDIIISVPSQNSFARFVNLPPVESKRIPEIVRFEAVQQIPFDINDVQWDWQLMTEPGSGGETRVGIFAVKNEVINAALEHFSRENVQVGYVQMAPMALYNYVLYDSGDLGKSGNRAVVILDIGAENTDLVVCTGSTVWQRCIPMGGNAFTKAIAETFKINFEKAEKLKRTAAMSKYARQIFQAMKGVFTELASEIQRSLGFYSRSNPNTKLSKVVAFGGGTKMRGLLKYLQQSLQIPIERLESFKRLAISSDVSAAKFHESVSDFGIVYGLGLQGLGLARMENNLLPRSVSRSMAWANKAKYFIAAASMVLLVSLLCFARTYLDNVNYEKNSGIRQSINRSNLAARQAIDKLQAEKKKGPGYEAVIQREFAVFKYRDVVPLLHETILRALPNEENSSEQKQKDLYKAFADGRVEDVLKVDRKERKQIFVTSMSVRYADDLESARFSSSKSQAGRRNIGANESNLATLKERELMEAQARGGAGQGHTYSSQRGSYGRGTKVDPKLLKRKSGFVVTVEGYSPYSDIGELLDPVGMENDPNKWGVITWLMHLDANSPFKLYKKTDGRHYGLDKGKVDLDSETPAGVGIEDVRLKKAEALGPIASGGWQSSSRSAARSIGISDSERVLVDPMTKEVISRVAELDEQGNKKIDPMTGKPVYEVNDHWFRLNVKFLWKDAPEKPKSTKGAEVSKGRRPFY